MTFSVRRGSSGEGTCVPWFCIERRRSSAFWVVWPWMWSVVAWRGSSRGYVPGTEVAFVTFGWFRYPSAERGCHHPVGIRFRPRATPDQDLDLPGHLAKERSGGSSLLGGVSAEGVFVESLIAAIEAFERGTTLVLSDVQALTARRPSRAHHDLRLAWRRLRHRVRGLREIRVSIPLEAAWLRTIPGFLGTPGQLGVSGDGYWRLGEVEPVEDRVLVRLVRASRTVGRTDVRHGSHVLAVATSSRSQFVGRTLGYVATEAGQVPLHESRSRRLPNPSTAVASSLRGTLGELARVGFEGDLHIWTPDELVRVALAGGPTTRVPEIHCALEGLVAATSGLGGRVVVHRVRRRGSVPHEIVARWVRLMVARIEAPSVL